LNIGNAHKLWVSFQNAACSIAQLYKDREQQLSLWLPFQNAASSVTSLYKECIESQKRFSEFGFQSGQQRRNKELLAWAMKRKRHIRREDLIAFLSGRNTANSFGHLHHHYHHSHHRTWNSPKQRLSISDSGISATSGRTAAHHSVALTRLSLSDGLTDSNSMTTISSDNNDETDLETFREALALSVGLRSSPQHGSNNISANSRRNNITRVSNNSTNNTSFAELNDFITEEYNRHVESRKRAASSSDVIMDSPTHKRSKLT
jgi:hypothetical protein